MAHSNNLAADTIYYFLRDDFWAAWDAIVDAQPDARGNFLFLRQALAILELACRVCAQSGVRLDRVGERLESEDRRCFNELPDRAGRLPREFTLPSRPNRALIDRQLLTVIYDLGRNGLAHQGQQIMAELSDGHSFGLSVSGVEQTKLADVAPGPPPADYLALEHTDKGNVWLTVHPSVLFLHITRAVERAGVFSAGDDPEYLTRNYSFDGPSLLEALRRQGHPEGEFPQG